MPVSLLNGIDVTERPLRPSDVDTFGLYPQNLQNPSFANGPSPQVDSFRDVRAASQRVAPKPSLRAGVTNWATGGATSKIGKVSNAASRAYGAADYAQSLKENFDALSDLHRSDKAELGDYAAGGSAS